MPNAPLSTRPITTNGAPMPHFTTFAALSSAIDAARKRVGHNAGYKMDGITEDLDVIGEPEIWQAFAAIPDEVAAGDACCIIVDRNLANLRDVITDLSFWPNDSKHLCLVLCLYATIAYRGGLTLYGINPPRPN